MAPATRGQGKRALMALLVISPVAMLNVLWFSSFSGGTLMGDDLDLVLQTRTPGGYASSFFASFTQTAADKFRPVVTVLLSVVTDLFGVDFRAYRVLTLMLQMGNVALVGVVAWRLSRRSWPVALAAMLLVTVSRFNVYFVLQIFGLMEGLALTFLLATVLAVHYSLETGNRRALAAANLCYFLALFTHERFIVLGAFLIVAALVSPAHFMTTRRRLAWMSIPLGVAASNLLVKSLVGVDFFTGPGGQDVTFGPRQILIFMGRAVLNIFGFNTGPDYLAGRNMHSLGALGAGLGIAFVAAVTCVGVLAYRAWSRMRAQGETGVPDAARAWLLGASLIGPLLLSASITFRQEFRWLYAPYVVLVLGVTWALGRLPARSRLQVLATAAVLLAGLTVDGYYRRHVENTYFFAGLRTADGVRETILDEHRAELASSTIFLVTHGDPVVDGWYLRSGGFFDVYAPGSDVRLVESVILAASAANIRSRVLVFEIQGERVVDITPQLPALAPGTGTGTGAVG